MNTKILFFGSLTDLFGRERMIELPPGGTTIAELRRIIAPEGAEAKALNEAGVRAAINQRVAGEDEAVRPGDEIAFFSPVSGG